MLGVKQRCKFPNTMLGVMRQLRFPAHNKSEIRWYSKTVEKVNGIIIIKSGWDNLRSQEPRFSCIFFSVNRTNEAISNAVLSDSMESPGVTYKAGSLRSTKVLRCCI